MSKVLIVLALVCFLLAAFSVPIWSLSLVPLGLACYMVALLV